MSIKETKFRKGFVETPSLIVDEILCNKVPDNELDVRTGKYLPIYDITEEDSGTWYPVEHSVQYMTDTEPHKNMLGCYFELCNKGTHKIPLDTLKRSTKIVRIVTPQTDNSTNGRGTLGIECYLVVYGIPAGGGQSFDTAIYLGKSKNYNILKHLGDPLVWNFDGIPFYNVLENGQIEEWDKFVISLATVPYKYDPETGNLILDDDYNRIEEPFEEAYKISTRQIAKGTGLELPVKQYIPLGTEKQKLFFGTLGNPKGGDGCRVFQTDKTTADGNGAFVNWTGQFTVYYTVEEEQPKIVPHKNNTQVHLTPQEKDEIKELLDNTSILELQDTLEYHMDDAGKTESGDESVYHVSMSLKILLAATWGILSDNMFPHIADANIHLSAADREKINNIPDFDGDINEMVERLDEIEGNLNTIDGNLNVIEGNLNTTSSSLTSHIGDSSHMTTAEKLKLLNVVIYNTNVDELAGSVESISEDLTEHTSNTNIHLSTDDKSKIASIDTLSETVSDLGEVLTAHMDDDSKSASGDESVYHISMMLKMLLEASWGALLQTINDLGNHTSNNSVHLSNSDKTAIGKVSGLELSVQTVSGDLSTHTSNTEIHIDSTWKNNVNNSISDITGDISALQGADQTLTGNINTINGNITTITSDIAKINGDITTITGDIATINGNITTITGDITAINGNVTDINQTIGGIQDDITALQAPSFDTFVSDLWIIRITSDMNLSTFFNTIQIVPQNLRSFAVQKCNAYMIDWTVSPFIDSDNMYWEIEHHIKFDEKVSKLYLLDSGLAQVQTDIYPIIIPK